MAEDPSEAQQNPEGEADLDQALAELIALTEQEALRNAPVGGQPVGPDVVNYLVPYFRQSSQFLCWFTSLHMIVAFHRGLNAEFTGHPTALTEGQTRDEERDAIRAQQTAETINDPQALQLLKARPPRGRWRLAAGWSAHSGVPEARRPLRATAVSLRSARSIPIQASRRTPSMLLNQFVACGLFHDARRRPDQATCNGNSPPPAAGPPGLPETTAVFHRAAPGYSSMAPPTARR
jgi:hypothetical protein